MNPSHSKVAKASVDLLGFLKRSGVVAHDEGVAIGTNVRGFEIILSYKQARRLADLDVTEDATAKASYAYDTERSGGETLR